MSERSVNPLAAVFIIYILVATACLNNGICEDVSGGFICHCSDGYQGDVCEYNYGECRCPPGAVCSQTDGGSTCIVAQSDNALLIEEPTVRNVAALDNTVNTLVEDSPVCVSVTVSLSLFIIAEFVTVKKEKRWIRNCL